MTGPDWGGMTGPDWGGTAGPGCGGIGWFGTCARGVPAVTGPGRYTAPDVSGSGSSALCLAGTLALPLERVRWGSCPGEPGC